MKPPTYRVQPGCHNCRHAYVVRHEGYDSEVYCALDGTPAPEHHGSLFTPDEFDAWLVAWNAWGEGREVDPAGICDYHEPGGEA